MKKRNLLFCLLATVLAACGENPSDSKTSTPVSGDGGTSDKVEITNPWWQTTGDITLENDKPVFEEVEIDLATVVAGEDLAAFNTIVRQFNAEYKNQINISVASINQAEFETSVSQKIANNDNPPDLIMSHQKGHMSFVESKLLQPFDEAMEASNNVIDMSDYAAGLAEYSDLGYKGHTFSIPCDAQSNVVYYNKALLERYGDVPTNRQELLDLCQKVKQGENITPIAWVTSGTDFFKQYTFRTAILQNGGTFYNSNYEVDWYSNETNRTAYKNAIKSIREMVNLGYADLDVAEATVTNRFMNNQALFYVALPWNANSIFDSYSKANGNISVETVKTEKIGATSIANWFCMTDNDEDSDKIYGDSHFFALSKSCKKLEEKAAAVEFIRWFTQTASVGAQWANAGHITASNIIDTDEEYNADPFVSNFINMWYPSINSFHSAGNNPYYNLTFNAIDSMFVQLKGANGSTDDNVIESSEEFVNDEISFFD